MQRDQGTAPTPPRLAAALGTAMAGGLAGLGAHLAGAGGGLTVAAAAAGAGLAAYLLSPRVTPPGAPPSPPGRPATPESPGLAQGRGRVLLEGLPIGVILIGRDRQLAFLNAAARSHFGPGARSGQPMAALRSPRLLEAVDRVLAAGGRETLQVAVSRAGPVTLSAHVSDLGPAEAEAGILVTVEDRTADRQAEILRRDFVANASHELKTPLATISGSIETLLGHARDDAEARGTFLDLIGRETARMRQLVEDLLSLNRIEINERVRPETPQPLGAILAEALARLARAAKQAGVALDGPDADGAAPETLVLADRAELVQLFVNLIDNALKYGRQGGRVTVSHRIGQDAEQGMVAIAIADDGPGIAREHIPRLTERFYRVSAAHSRAKGGTGLGLAIVKHIVHRHRGRLEIESSPGEGAVFTVWLPLAPDG